MIAPLVILVVAGLLYYQLIREREAIERLRVKVALLPEYRSYLKYR